MSGPTFVASVAGSDQAGSLNGKLHNAEARTAVDADLEPSVDSHDYLWRSDRLRRETMHLS